MSRCRHPAMITFFIIATKSYKEYARSLVASIERHVKSDFEIQLLTDDVAYFAELTALTSRGTLQASTIESLGWPAATLRRYELMLSRFQAISGGVTCYLDADTLFCRDTSITDFLGHVSDVRPVATVRHPGYFKRSMPLRLLNVTVWGPWENRRSSSAYVPFSHRRDYVCGGVIFGLTAAFQRMCEEIQRLITVDRHRGIIARHNDESYLNAWCLRHSIERLSPEWAYAAGYRNLRDLTPRIEVIHKPSDWIREI